MIGVANDGRVAQLGEHLLCKQGVTGSIPVTSTNVLLMFLGFATESYTKKCTKSAVNSLTGEPVSSSRPVPSAPFSLLPERPHQRFSCKTFRSLLHSRASKSLVALRSGRDNQESVFILSAGRGKEDLPSDHGYHTPELQAGTVFGSGGGREVDSVQPGLEAFLRLSGRSSPTG